MPNPEILSTEVPAGPEGSIFLPMDSLTIREIDKQLFQMHLVRGELGGLEPEVKAELAAKLHSQRAQLAELALRSS